MRGTKTHFQLRESPNRVWCAHDRYTNTTTTNVSNVTCLACLKAWARADTRRPSRAMKAQKRMLR